MTLMFLATLAVPPPAAGEELAVTAPAVGATNEATAPGVDARTESLPAEAAKPGPDEKAFVPPDGWRPKKRGKFTVYCRKDNVKGTRIPAEICYDEQGIRDMLAEQRDDREKVDQLRRICGSQAACGSR